MKFIFILIVSNLINKINTTNFKQVSDDMRKWNTQRRSKSNNN